MVCGPPQIPAAEAAAALRPGAAQAGQVAPGVAAVPVSYAYTHKMIQGVEVVEESCIPRNTESPVSPGACPPQHASKAARSMACLLLPCELAAATRSMAAAYHVAAARDMPGSDWVHESPKGPECPAVARAENGLSQERDILHSGLDRAAALCHQDGITHMTSVDSADRILLTASHDGLVKAWK